MSLSPSVLLTSHLHSLQTDASSVWLSGNALKFKKDALHQARLGRGRVNHLGAEPASPVYSA